MVFRPVGVDENSDFPPRIEARLAAKFAAGGGGTPSNPSGGGYVYEDPTFPGRFLLSSEPGGGSGGTGVGFVNAKATPYSATGDGTSDDTAAIQSAMAAAGAAGGGTVVLPTGSYSVTSLTIPSDVILTSLGGATLLHRSGATQSCVNLPNSNSVLRDVEVDGNAANQANSVLGVSVGGVRNRVEGCYVHDVKWDGIAVGGGSRHNVTDCTVVTTGRFGITVNWNGVTATNHVIVNGNHVEASVAGALGIVGVGEHIVFVGNTTKDHGGDGIAAYNALNQDIVCSGNTFENPGNHGIHLGGQGLIMADNNAVGVGTGHGFFVRNHDATTAYHATITGNTVRGVGIGEGIRVEITQIVTIGSNTVHGAARHGIQVNDSADFTVTGNVVRDNIAGSGIDVFRSERGTITGNTLRNIGGDAIKGYDTGGTANACQLVTVTGNTVTTATGWGLRTIELTNRWLHGGNIYRLTAAGASSLVGANNVSTGPDLTA